MSGINLYAGESMLAKVTGLKDASDDTTITGATGTAKVYLNGSEVVSGSFTDQGSGTYHATLDGSSIAAGKTYLVVFELTKSPLNLKRQQYVKAQHHELNS